jgi:hypothetical protein
MRHFGIQIWIACGRELTQKESFIIDKKAEDIQKEIDANTIKNDPDAQERARNEKRQILALFPQPIYVDEIPNGYCPDYCCRHLPWFIVTTTRGRFKIGWRKRVISIDWEDSTIYSTAEEMFKGEDTTKGGRSIHAWSYEKAGQYIAMLLADTKPKPAKE